MNFTKEGKIIKQARLNKNLAQVEVATKLGWSSAQFISNIERGLAGVPSHCIKKVSKILGLDKEELIETKVKAFQDHLKSVSK